MTTTMTKQHTDRQTDRHDEPSSQQTSYVLNVTFSASVERVRLCEVKSEVQQKDRVDRREFRRQKRVHCIEQTA